ncbi:MPN499 family protein [Mesomycoplasma conjunctivae]|uniref:MPN499 family protein n=1 Tax=Mesomycoplasma conjunctivae TaxID=45361 RepID=UPI003DA5DA0C
MNDLISYITKISKIRINHHNNGFWLVPSVRNYFSFRLTAFVIKKTDTLEEMILRNNWISKEVIFNFNGDNNFVKFNLALKLREINFRLDAQQIKKLSDKSTLSFFPIDNCEIILDKKGLQLIYDGIIPFFSKKYYHKLLEQQQRQQKQKNISFLWRSFGFKEIKKHEVKK